MKHNYIVMALMSVMALGSTDIVAEEAKLNLGYSFNWAFTVEGTVSQSSNIIGIKEMKDDNVMVGLLWGSSTRSGKSVTWNGQQLKDSKDNIIEGANYLSGASHTQNFLLTKMDKDGNPTWKVYTDEGYVEQSYSDFDVMEDGGVVCVLHVRQADFNLENTSSYYTDCYLEIVDAKGEKFRFTHPCVPYALHHVVMFKVDSEGSLVWSRLIDSEDDENKDMKRMHTDGIAVDYDGSIYLGGYIEGSAIFPISAEETQTVKTDDASVFVAKFDKDGYMTKLYVNKDARYVTTKMDKMLITSDKVYVVGPSSFTADKDIRGLTLLSMNKDLTSNIKYVDYFNKANSDGKVGLNIYGFKEYNSKIYIMGGVTGSIVMNSSEQVLVESSQKGSTRDAFIARCDAEGNPEASLVNGVVSTTYNGLTFKDGLFYATLCSLGSDGTYINVLDGELNLLKSTNIVKSGMTSVATSPLLMEDGRMILALRGAKASSAYYGTTSVVPEIKNSFGVIMGCWSIVEEESAVKNVRPSVMDNNYYDLSGRRVTKPVKGMYIHNNKLFVK